MLNADIIVVLLGVCESAFQATASFCGVITGHGGKTEKKCYLCLINIFEILEAWISMNSYHICFLRNCPIFDIHESSLSNDIPYVG